MTQFLIITDIYIKIQNFGMPFMNEKNNIIMLPNQGQEK